MDLPVYPFLDQTDFGDVTLSNSVDYTYDIVNSGGSNLFLTGTPVVDISGSHSNSFAVTLVPATNIADGASDMFTIQFTPLVVGVNTALVSIANDDANENPYTFRIEGDSSTNQFAEIALFGASGEIANGDSSPSVGDGTDFGSIVITSSLVNTFTVTNSGLVSLNLNGSPKVQVTGAHAGDFQVSLQPSSPIVSLGASTFDLTFAPVTEGVRSATVSISNDDPNESPYEFSVQGVATPEPSPEIQIDFGGQEVLSAWLKDEATSQLIDLGDPNRAITNELAPNGDVINMGAYADSMEASLSPTNPYVFAITASSGGLLFGIFDLVWNYGNVDPTNTVTLEYSFDNGVSWTTIVQNVSITNRSSIWINDAQSGGEDIFLSSPIGRWQLTVDSETNITDITDNFFALRNSPFIFYLNDDSTTNDVYTSVEGDDSNLGFFPNAPKRTLTNLLSQIDVEGDDTIRFDTGNYTFGATAVIGGSDQGIVGLPVIIHGSTNGSGAVLSGASPAIRIDAAFVTMSNLIFQGTSLSSQADNTILNRITITSGGGVDA